MWCAAGDRRIIAWRFKECVRLRRPMPELPEVETVVRDLRPLLVGRRFTSVWASRLALRKPWKAAWKMRLVGRRVDGGAAARQMDRIGAGRRRPACCPPWHDRTFDRRAGKGAEKGAYASALRPGRRPAANCASVMSAVSAARRCFPPKRKSRRFSRPSGLGPEPFGLDPPIGDERMASTSRCVKAVLLDQTRCGRRRQHLRR